MPPALLRPSTLQVGTGGVPELGLNAVPRPISAKPSRGQALAKVDVDAEEYERPDDNRYQRLQDPAQRAEVVEVVVHRGDDHADDEVNGTKRDPAHLPSRFPVAAVVNPASGTA